jgi:hypothetical protein
MIRFIYRLATEEIKDRMKSQRLLNKRMFHEVRGQIAVTLGYTAGYLLIGLEPIRLCTYIV